MSLRLGIPRASSRLLCQSIRPQRLICMRCYSLLPAEQTKPSIVPGSQSTASSSLRETKTPETLHPPPAPPKNDAPSASSITSSKQTTTPQLAAKSASPSASPATPTPSASTSSATSAGFAATLKKEPKFAFKPRKAALTLTPNAISRLKEMLDQPTPKLVRVGVKNRGCAGLAYHLEYVDKAGKFDEVVEQDGVKVLIDSRALFSIIGSRMDFVEDRLSARFVFDNPHVKGSCGCGESFSVG